MIHPDEQPGAGEYAATDDHREISFVEDLVILPDTTADDTDAGWGERASSNDDRLLEERPPHWE
ncbi:MAG: hypothetical protein JXA67_09190 [Micromonosporaceae bacterium]|nr:hypothetical protein [Micromonosporaceae bacterium]